MSSGWPSNNSSLIHLISSSLNKFSAFCFVQHFFQCMFRNVAVFWKNEISFRKLSQLKKCVVLVIKEEQFSHRQKIQHIIMLCSQASVLQPPQDLVLLAAIHFQPFIVVSPDITPALVISAGCPL
eukprot:TRINITY_DN11652_c0_g1_i13.p5 TRINITY_DN11652_c0_g1~~TRINITY_DN11652_c0_g1_i13.p5  ORF type:complete len:125 (-),score=7.66 TRINITY_DN11652_c0_g1_i13:9-383(-)